MSGQSSSGASVGPPLVLEILAGPDAGRRQPLPDGGLVLGRGEDADLRLTDEMISRRHVWVERAAGGARVVDLGSANGLWIGGERQSEAALADGGTFRIGASTICVLADAPVRAEPASPKPAAQKPAAPERTSSESAESQSAVLGPAAPASARPEPPASGPVAPQPGPSEPTPPEPAAGQLIRPEPVVGESRAPEPPGNDSVPIGETRTAESEEDPDDDVEQHELSPGLAHLASLGTPREASGNAPFLLDDPEAMWLVEAGRVEIFAVGVEAGRPVGARSHYLTVEPGEAFFGMDFGSYRVGAGFLAVGRRGTRLRTVPRGALRSVAAGADSDSGKNSLASPAGDPAAALGGLVDGWVEGMTRRLSRDMLRPLVDVSLVPGEPVEVERDQKARPLRGVTWLDVPTGQLLWVGLEELEPTSAFPLTSDAWAEGTEELGPTTPVEPRLVGEALADGSLWAGLDLFHQLLCRCEFVNKKLAKVDDLARLRSKADDARQAREAALDDLASVLRPDDDDAAIVGDSTVDDPIFRALVRVGAAQDIQVRPHPDDVSDRLPEDRVAVYAKASGVRARKVALRGRWWREDNGPILARLEDAETPVALVPRGARAYDLIDPRDGSRTTVDAKVADGLDGFGWVLYRTLPEGTIGIKKLLGFGARGLRRDFTTLGVMGIVVGLLGALTPFFTGQIFD
ncbi:MAG: FHA domain-containing protein, partial [Acidobacteriota bacterium]